MVLYLRFYRDDLKEPQDLNQLFDCAKEGTWRLTKITNFPVVTRIRFSGGEKPMDIGLEGQEATLGTLWDLALRVRKRSITKWQNLHKLNWGTDRSFKAADYVPGLNKPN